MGQGMLIFTIAVATVTFLVHLAFAFAVYLDARDQDRPTIFVGALTWGLATLLGGVVVAALYWAMHHSTLRPAAETSDVPVTETPAPEE